MTSSSGKALEVTVQQRTDAGWPVVAEWTSSDALPVRAEGRLQLDLSQLEMAIPSRLSAARDLWHARRAVGGWGRPAMNRRLAVSG